MRIMHRVPVLAALAALLWLTATPVLADEFSEFRIPDHRLYGASATLSGSASRWEASSGLEPSSGRSHSYFTWAQGSAFWMRDSEKGLTSLSWTAGLSGSRMGLRRTEDRSG